MSEDTTDDIARFLAGFVLIGIAFVYQVAVIVVPVAILALLIKWIFF